MLFARSYRIIEFANDVAEDVAAKTVSVRSPQLLDAFRRIKNREPAPGEIEEISRQAAESFVNTGSARIRSVEHAHDSVFDLLERTHIVAYGRHPNQTGFIIADSPIVLARGEGLIDVSRPDHRFALNDAGLVLMPIHRHLAVAFVTEPEPSRYIERRALDITNNATWRSATRFVVVHPHEKHQFPANRTPRV